jgi:hypothetical protein
VRTTAKAGGTLLLGIGLAVLSLAVLGPVGALVLFFGALAVLLALRLVIGVVRLLRRVFTLPVAVVVSTAVTGLVLARFVASVRKGGSK